MKIIKVEAVKKDDKVVRRIPEVNAKDYFNAIFEFNQKVFTATIRSATNYIADCRDEDDQRVRFKEETERKLIDAIYKYNKKLELY